jgi:hypothetical protein
MRSSKCAGLLILSILCTALATTSSAATPYSEDAIMAAYLVRFAGYVEWPDETTKAAALLHDAATPPPASPNSVADTSALAASVPETQKSPLTIAVLGGSGIWDELTQLVATQSTKQRTLRIRRITAVADIGDARIVFIGAEHADRLKRLLAALAHKPVLTVTDDVRGLEFGSVLNFMHADRRVRFEVSLVSAKKAGLKISSDLLAVATRVELAANDMQNCQFASLKCAQLGALR